MDAKLPPHSRESEQEVLGGMFRSDQAISEVLQMIGPEHFYLDAHQKIARAVVDLYQRGTRADVGSVAEVLKDRKQLEDIGGYDYLKNLVYFCPAPATARFHAGIVRSKAMFRHTILACHEILRDAEDPVGSAEELLESAQQKISAIAQIGLDIKIIDAPRLIGQVYDRIDDRIQRYLTGQKIVGIPSGLVDLDGLTAGFQDSELIIIAARTSVGKTALGIFIAQHAAVDLGFPVYVVSLEQPAIDLGDRLLACRSSVDLRVIRSGQIDRLERQVIQETGSGISHSPLWICDSRTRGMLQVCSTARLLKRQHNIRLMVVDYLQLVPPEDPRVRREEQVATISRGLKSLAMELQIPIIAMAQLNRALEQRSIKRPRLSDLRESGAIEQDADTVILLHCPADEEDEDGKNQHSPIKEIEVEVAKQRNGPTGRLRLIFRKAFVRFENYAPPVGNYLPGIPE